ncbi:MAG: Crp/Fnr family transcriptional regulator [Tissierellia bacterium]|nr:Crp/Fnr family transcriptional regulator [Tissierellia bacterium]
MSLRLEEVTLFKGLKEEEIKSVLDKHAQRQEFKKGEYIFVKGDKPKYMYILEKGSLSVFNDDVFGKRELLSSFSNPGDLFAEVYLYLEKRTYHFSAIADSDLKLIVISKEFFNQIYDLNTKIGRIVTENYLNILSEKLYYFNQKIRMISGFTLRQKLSRYILENRDDGLEFNLTYNREELADYLGSTRPSVSRELSKMQEEGLINIDRSKIIILDLEELNNYS